jgi:hypothetical protein
MLRRPSPTQIAKIDMTRVGLHGLGLLKVSMSDAEERERAAYRARPQTREEMALTRLAVWPED